jgi:glucokinase
MIIGIDVGGTKMSGGLASPDGTLIARSRYHTDRAGGAEAGLRLICTIIEELQARGAVERIGVGFGGPVDFERGVVLRSHHVAAWEGFALRDELSRRFGVPVVLDNDANTGTLGEWRFGAGRGLRDIVYVNVGSGIGGGVVANGQLVRGKGNLAGEIGHMVVRRGGPRCTCGKQGCLEACASGDAIARRGREALGRPVKGEELFALAREGNGTAREVLAGVIDDLAVGIGAAVSLLDPGAVIIGGGLSEAPEDLFLEPLRRAVPSYCLPDAAAHLRIEPAQLRYDAGIMGAIALGFTDEHGKDTDQKDF